MPLHRAIRLYFKNTTKGLKLIRSRHVNMRAPAVLEQKILEKKEDLKSSVGFWLDVLNEKGETLFSRSVPELGRDRLEAYTGDEKQPFILSEKRNADLITILLPDVSEAVNLKIRQQTISIPKKINGKVDSKNKLRKRIKTREVIEVDLRKLEQQGGDK